MSLEQVSELIMVIPGNASATYRKLCSKFMLKELARSNPEIQANLEAEDAQAKSIEGNGKRRRSIEDEETAEERTAMRYVKMSGYKLAIAENIAKAQEATARAQEATARAQEATARAGKVVSELQNELIAGLPDTVFKDKAVAYMNIHKTNTSMRVFAPPTQAENSCKRLIEDETNKNAEEVGMEIPDIVREGRPLLITSVLAEKGLRDNDQHLISKAVGVIASRLYRDKHKKGVNKAALFLNNGKEVRSNAYMEVDREVLEQAVNEYMQNNDTSMSKTRKQKPEKKTRTQTRLNFGRE